MSFLSLVITRAPLDGAFVPKRKMSALAAGIAATGATVAGAMSGIAASNLNTRNRKWQEDMYNKYSSPAAMMRQYREANINPYLSSTANVGSGMEATPPQAMPQFPDIGSAAAQGLQAGVAVDKAPAEIGLMESESLNKVTTSLVTAANNMNNEQLNSYLSILAPRLKGVFKDESLGYQYMLNTVGIQLAQKEIVRIEADWQKQFGSEKRSTDLMQAQNECMKIIADMNLMSSQADLNRQMIEESKQKINESFAKIAEIYAAAYSLKKQGDKYIADTKTADQIRSLIVNGLILQNGVHGLNVLTGEQQYNANKVTLNPYWLGVKEGLGAVGNVIKVVKPFDFGNIGSAFGNRSGINVPYSPQVAYPYAPPSY